MTGEGAIVHDTPPGQLAPTRRQIIVGGTLLAATAAGFALMPRTVEKLLGDARLEALVPKTLGSWSFEAASGLVLPPQDQLRDKIYSQLLTRVYSRADGASVMLLIAYSGAQDGTIQIHRPEVCYPASGYRLVEIDAHSIPLNDRVRLPSRYIVAESDVRREQIVYWTRLGSHFPTKWSEQKTAVIEENLAGVIPDGVLVRISSIAAGNAMAVFDGFARDLYNAVGNHMKQVLVGRVLGGDAAAR